MPDKKGVINLEQEARIMQGRKAFHAMPRLPSNVGRNKNPRNSATAVLIEDMKAEQFFALKIKYLPIVE